MTDEKEKENKFENFLIEEYKYLTTCFWKNEELGERRIGFFVSVASVVLAAIVALTEESVLGVDINPVFLQLISFILLLLGFVTLERMIHRNSKSDEYKIGLDRIRRYFVKKEDSKFRGYLLLDPHIDFEYHEHKKKLSFGTGGLITTIILVNSVIIAVTLAWFGWYDWVLKVANDDYRIQLGVVLVVGIIGFFFGWFIQMFRVQSKEQKNKQKLHEKEKKRDELIFNSD